MYAFLKPVCHKKSRLLGATAVMVALSVPVAGPACAVTAAGQAEAEIINATAPVLTPVDDLDFGEIITTGVAGTVTISTAGAPTLSNVSLTGTSPHQQAVIRITGNPSDQVDINIVPGAYAVNNGLFTMPVTAFDLGAGPNVDNTVTLSAGGIFDVNIGATLGVGAAQQPGNYSGTFTLNADYH